MTDAVYAELDRLLAERDRHDMAPTLAALKAIHDEHPTDARVLYEYAGAHDTAGQEEAAAELYERALAAGLEGDVRRRCLLQYGSTLRNLDRFDESIEVFGAARVEFPDAASLAVFEAITLHAAGQVHASLGSLLDVIADHVDSAELERYKPAIRGNAAYLLELDAD
ncbi:tetratricopeptide repeat protein [Microbacterium oleivorans]|uniref:tetratricopeptide repeat protein n=1 Tax=Microbacterium oleivorans TaxID=273677 RepID=UPI00203DFF67|nr:tetratricopeptide repeat protein [Microbacterium oleivorans]MCM3694889.1 tetratricopeptide repeat protein [Microbacterium oleivorans]